jgi:hypothetical protein
MRSDLEQDQASFFKKWAHQRRDDQGFNELTLERHNNPRTGGV